MTFLTRLFHGGEQCRDHMRNSDMYETSPKLLSVQLGILPVYLVNFYSVPYHRGLLRDIGSNCGDLPGAHVKTSSPIPYNVIIARRNEERRKNHAAGIEERSNLHPYKSVLI